MPLPEQTKLGPYQVVSSLGVGAMGEVYRARDSRLDRDVAIKVLPDHLAGVEGSRARFQREMKAVASLSHPNILSVYDIGTEGNITYAVMELLEGQTLGRLLRGGALSWPKVVEMGRQIASGLAAAHAKGVIHRDLKPENIFLTTGGGLKILDFGLARIEQNTSGDGLLKDGLETQPGVILGTVAYMSPEQVRGEPADARSDVFSFGVVFYEMLLGRRPFRGGTAPEVMAAILQEPVSDLSQSGRRRPAELDRMILQCLVKNPGARLQAMPEVVALLSSLGRGAISGGNPELSAVATVVDSQPTKTPSGQSAVPSVAVLPFENLSSDKENEYFSDGLAEELANALAKVAGLRVASRTSSFAFKGKREDVRRIGELLNVRAVLEGSVRKAGNRLRIAAQLVNVEDGFHLWSETFNREMEDVFAIQDEIAQNIVKALRGILTESDKELLVRAMPADVRAYECYLRGRQYFHQFSRKGFEFANQMFSRAIALDPAYALAYAGLADAHSLLYTYWDPNPRNLDQADSASHKALQLDSKLAEAHVARGLALTMRKAYDEAENEFQTAAALAPTLFEAPYFHGRACLAQGKLLEAARLFEQACRLRPEDYQASSHLPSIYRGLGRKADAQAAADRAVQVMEKHLELHPDDARAMYLVAVAHTHLEDRERALDWADRAVLLDPNEPVTRYNVACVYSLQGRVEEAVQCLIHAVKLGFAHKEWIEHDADLDAVKEHPAYLELMQAFDRPGRACEAENT